MVKASMWQNIVMALVCVSFIYANTDKFGAAHELWKSSPESMMVFLGLGVGMKMTKDVLIERMAANKAKGE